MTSASPEARRKRAREGPKKEIGGNSGPDQRWLAEVAEAGEIHEPDYALKPVDFFYEGILYQWDGLADEVNPDFFKEQRRYKSKRWCNGTAYVRDQRGGYVIDAEWNRITRPCLGLPIRGAEVCHKHGGNIPAVKAAAERVLAEAAEVVALRLVGLTAPTDENQESIDHKVRLGAANSVLDRAGIKGGTTIEVTVPGYKRILTSMFGDDSEEGSEP